ncbi:MAG: CRISPR-associated endoribonuclease Cas6 [bacterium]|nr:CRISPR-associated endoribonuclease Cas6 [bacterium]
MPRPKFDGDTIHLDSTEISLNFSTVDSKLGIYFYNSILKNRFEPYPLPRGNSLRLKGVRLQKEQRIDSTEVVFKTMSPFLVRLHHKEDNMDEYLTKHHNLLVSQMEESIACMLKKLMKKEERIEFLPVKLKEPIPIKHYGLFLEANAGLFKLTGSRQALDFIYKAGIGSRRAEGFGLLEYIG